ncbi:hypothetical protein Tco_0662768 [Tanacetum coccineum]
MTTLAEFMIIAGAENHPPMLEKSLYDSWKSQDDTTRTKRYEEVLVAEKLQADCDLKATNIIVQGLPPDVYAIVNHHKFPKKYGQSLVVLVFNQGDDPITYLNKAMSFLIVVVSSRFPSTNNQLRTSSNLRNHATILDGGQTRVVKCYNCQGEGHMALAMHSDPKSA